ncbi:hypothetical protein [Anaeromyxobacter dehalogenans]|uniref:O-antigen polymerase n=1 Tax=Anaeromyxobacter dehalogenans (strain 2CP-C) TaxID=290397 RepID=Q2IHJ3_ANADE|nr:hypothetical protein [Anaeromyxobacter dehalogenans]ABC84048.1 hypothetical protein Adeh_4284 [Anaeromyxobacter dehalogenans 2CP-C]
MTIRLKAGGMRMLGRFLQYVLPPVALVVAARADTFVTAYLAFALVGVLTSLSAHREGRLLILATTGYLLVALLNISTWRGRIEPPTVAMYAAALYALHLPFLLLPRRRRLAIAPLRPKAVVRIALVGHFALALGAVCVVYATRGIIVLHQELRFGLPPALLYLASSTLPIAVVAPFFFPDTKHAWMLASVAMLPALLLGVRGTPVVAAFGFVLGRLYVRPMMPTKTTLTKTKALVLLGLVGLSVIALGFHIRRTANPDLETPERLARLYFDDPDEWWVLPVMPLYLGVRETVGLTNAIISNRITNDVNESPLFFADLFTVLPGEQLDAGQSMGRVFGSTDGGGLTPGLLGGLYIDYGVAALGGFFIIGAMLAALARCASFYCRCVPLYILALTQAIHLFHRGFLKPEYFTSLAIAGFYVLLATRTAGAQRSAPPVPR